jgi:arylsulfatase A-like enzyme
MAMAMVIAVGCGGDKEGEGAPGPDSPTPDPPEATAPAADETPTRVEHAVFSLIDNRVLAHRQRGGGLLIDAGAGGFVRYTNVGTYNPEWSLGHTVDDIPVARPDRTASVFVTLTEAQAAAHEILLRVHTSEARRLHVAVNQSIKDSGVPMASLEAGWQTIEIETDRLTPGLAELQLRYSHGSTLSVAWIQIGGEAAGVIEPMMRDHALSLGRDDGLTYYAFVPTDAALVASISEGCALEVTAAARDLVPVTSTLKGPNARLDLASLGGHPARIELIARDCDRAAVSDAALMVPGPAPDVHGGAPPKNVILWVMDTLRGDKMRTVNPDARAEIPTLAKLAETGAAFRQYYVQGNESQTSHSSVWTSLYPVNHRVITSGPATNYQLSKRFEAIGPLMKAAGLRTVGVTANGTITNWAGYTRGFDVYSNLMKDGTGRRMGFRVPGDIVYERALDKLGSHEEPFFLFIGTIDTHKPWYGHEPWLSRYDPGPYEGRFDDKVLSAQLGIPTGTHLCKWKVPPREMQRIHAIIDSAISFQDQQLGRLVAQLEEWGIADETMLVVTADHGEELWEYPHRCGHGSSLRESLTHVPLMIHYPPLIPGGAVLEGADGVDILPTILDALGQPPLEAAQGQSLIPLLQGAGRGYPRPSYASMNEWAHTMRLDRYKAWVGRAGDIALYDMTDDPDERNDLASTHPISRQFLADALGLFLANRRQWKKRDWGVASNLTAAGARAIESGR